MVQEKQMEEAVTIKNTEMAEHHFEQLRSTCSMLAENAIKVVVKDHEAVELGDLQKRRMNKKFPP